MSCLEAECMKCGRMYFGNSIEELLSLKTCDCDYCIQVTDDETGLSFKFDPREEKKEGAL